MIFYLMRPCRTRAGFVSTLKIRLRMDFKKSAQLLRNNGFHVTDAGPLLIVTKGIECSLFPSGKIILKTDSEEKAVSMAEDIYEITLADWGKEISREEAS